MQTPLQIVGIKRKEVFPVLGLGSITWAFSLKDALSVGVYAVVLAVVYTLLMNRSAGADDAVHVVFYGTTAVLGLLLGGFYRGLRRSLVESRGQVAFIAGSTGSVYVALNLGAFFVFDAALAPGGLNVAAALSTVALTTSMAFLVLSLGVSLWARVRGGVGAS